MQPSISREHALCIELLRQGKSAQAIEKLSAAMEAHPRDSRIATDLLRVLILEQRFDDAIDLVARLSPDALDDEQLDLQCAQVELITASNPAESDMPKLLVHYYQSLEKNPQQLDKRLKLASILLKIDDIESSLEQLYAIRQCDRTFRNDIGHRGMLALFGILGEKHELVARYRKKIC